jgi:hypothetical protein
MGRDLKADRRSPRTGGRFARQAQVRGIDIVSGRQQTGALTRLKAGDDGAPGVVEGDAPMSFYVTDDPLALGTHPG